MSIFLCACAYADHLDESLIAKGPPETKLSGIEVGKLPMRSVLAKLGKPARNEQIPEGEQKSSGHDYEWHFGALKLLLGTFTPNLTEPPYSIEVWGDFPHKAIGQTGRGLKLGDTLARVHQLYGKRYFRQSEFQILLEFSNENQLTIGFAPNGRINYMQLTANIE